MGRVTKEDVWKIIEDAGVDADLDKIKSGHTLIDAGVDSLDLANVLLGIEESFNIKIPDEDVEALASIDAIVSYLSTRLGS